MTKVGSHHLDARSPRLLEQAERLPDDRLLTVQELADMLSLSVQTLHGWRCAGKGPAHVRLGAAVRYRLSDIRQWIAGRVYHQSSQGRPPRNRPRPSQKA